MMQEWKTDLEEVTLAANSARKADVRCVVTSAGKRPVWMFTYGAKEELHPRANYNSACGGKDVTTYLDRKHKKPVILIVGAIHGQETEGTAALLNLIQLLETGAELSGKKNTDMQQAAEHCRLLLIPVMNPDGRARMKRQTVFGMTADELSRTGTGVWKDGTLCRWPYCKQVHPVTPDDVSVLGCYYNDDGVNMMHDQFFHPMAAETTTLFRLMEEECVDCVLLLHGGSNSQNVLLQPSYVPLEINQAIRSLAERCDAVARRENSLFACKELPEKEQGETPPAFNLVSALHHINGAVSATFESNECVNKPGGPQWPPEQIMRGHMILFEQTCRMFRERQQGE